MASHSILAPTRDRVQPKQRRRAKATRARTGCTTCKIRRVKCDETKPVCRRCVKFGIDCDGYAPEKLSKRPRTLPLDRGIIQVIAPKSILQTPHHNPFANDQEYQYFRLFCERTASTLAGNFRGSLWNRIILQACEDMPSIRHAIIALGALDKTLDITQRTGGPRSSLLLKDFTESTVHHQFALQQYSKAITQMRDNLFTRTRDYRAALILCLLTICFEALNGDMQSAQEQLRNGLKLIREWRMSMTAKMLGPGISLQSPRIGNDELMRAFDCLDNNSIMIMNSVPVMGTGAEDSIDNVQKSFLSLEDARAGLELLVSAMLHWVASIYAWATEEKDEAKRRFQLFAARPSEVMKLSDLERSRNEQRQKFIEDFKNWRSAFQPLWLKYRSISSDKNFATALALEMRFKALYTSLLGDHFLGDTVYDAFIAEFREIVELGKSFMEHETLQSDSQRATFTFDDPLIPSIYFVILKCRDPSLRREAISLLQSHPRRDSIMDSALMVRIGTLQMNIEEAGIEDGYIPEHARIRGIKTTTDIVKRSGVMKYLKMTSPSNREFLVHQVSFTW